MEPQFRRTMNCSLLNCPLTHLMAVFSFVCSAPPQSPFGNISSSLGEDGALISWEYLGPEKNVYVEYVVENSKQSNIFFLTAPHRWQETPTSFLACAGE